MSVSRNRLYERYVGALRSHLRRKSMGNGVRMHSLGRAALSEGLTMKDLALVHERALVALAQSFNFGDIASGSISRASYFFTQTMIPVEAAWFATQTSIQVLKERNETLRSHTIAMAKETKKLEREIALRIAGEEAILKAKHQYEQLYLESQIMHKKLTLLTRQILSVQEDERKEISRELHDEVVQTLVGVNVELAALSKGASIGSHLLQSKIARTQKLVEKSVKAVHRFARDLRPAVLDDLGLIPALNSYNKTVMERNKVHIRLSAIAAVETLSNARRTVLYRVAQEALTNVIRHACATHVTMNISEGVGTICMAIHDDGKSFDVKKVFMSRNSKRLGLLGMRERVEMVGGTLSIESETDKGTTVKAEIPIN
ncbi:MAG: sensor histidine kinase [Verrucomicrobiota bacterium]|nr:sensor histidine kinase [Verrucomicrobiota bacterium]